MKKREERKEVKRNREGREVGDLTCNPVTRQMEWQGERRGEREGVRERGVS